MSSHTDAKSNTDAHFRSRSRERSCSPAHLAGKPLSRSRSRSPICLCPGVLINPPKHVLHFNAAVQQKIKQATHDKSEREAHHRASVQRLARGVECRQSEAVVELGAAHVNKWEEHGQKQDVFRAESEAAALRYFAAAKARARAGLFGSSDSSWSTGDSSDEDEDQDEVHTNGLSIDVMWFLRATGIIIDNEKAVIRIQEHAEGPVEECIRDHLIGADIEVDDAMFEKFLKQQPVEMIKQVYAKLAYLDLYNIEGHLEQSGLNESDMPDTLQKGFITKFLRGEWGVNDLLDYEVGEIL